MGKPIELIDTTGISEEKWLEVREHGLSSDPTSKDFIPYTITGSGASSALGVNKFVSDREYRDKKMGIKPVLDAKFNEEAKAAGHVFEPFVAINFLRYMHLHFPEVKINLKKDCLRDILPYLRSACPDTDSYKDLIASQDKILKSFNKKWDLNPSSMYQCGTTDEDGELKYPFALANIDGLVEVNGKLGIFEAKTTSSTNDQYDYWLKGKIPPYYYWQLVFYMAVMDVDFAYITCCWGFTLNDMAVLLLERDKDIEREFMDYLSQFVKDMEIGLPLEESKSDPELVSNYYYRLYGPASERREIELPASCQAIVKEAENLEEEIKEVSAELEALKKRKADIANRLQPIMTDNLYAKIEMPDKSIRGIKLKPSMKRAKFDDDRFFAEHPELMDDFGMKVVNVDKLKKSPLYKKLATEYTIPGEPNEKGKAGFEIFEYSKKDEGDKGGE